MIPSKFVTATRRSIRSKNKQHGPIEGRGRRVMPSAIALCTALSTAACGEIGELGGDELTNTSVVGGHDLAGVAGNRYIGILVYETDSGSGMCTATLIDDRHILTDAACVTGNTRKHHYSQACDLMGHPGFSNLTEIRDYYQNEANCRVQAGYGTANYVRYVRVSPNHGVAVVAFAEGIERSNEEVPRAILGTRRMTYSQGGWLAGYGATSVTGNHATIGLPKWGTNVTAYADQNWLALSQDRGAVPGSGDHGGPLFGWGEPWTIQTGIYLGHHDGTTSWYRALSSSISLSDPNADSLRDWAIDAACLSAPKYSDGRYWEPFGCLADGKTWWKGFCCEDSCYQHTGMLTWEGYDWVSTSECVQTGPCQCTGGVDVYGNTVTAQCGDEPVCGADRQLYDCVGGEWSATEVACTSHYDDEAELCLQRLAAGQSVEQACPMVDPEFLNSLLSEMDEAAIGSYESAIAGRVYEAAENWYVLCLGPYWNDITSPEVRAITANGLKDGCRWMPQGDVPFILHDLMTATGYLISPQQIAYWLDGVSTADVTPAFHESLWHQIPLDRRSRIAWNTLNRTYPDASIQFSYLLDFDPTIDEILGEVLEEIAFDQLPLDLARQSIGSAYRCHTYGQGCGLIDSALRFIVSMVTGLIRDVRIRIVAAGMALSPGGLNTTERLAAGALVLAPTLGYAEQACRGGLTAENAVSCASLVGMSTIEVFLTGRSLANNARFSWNRIKTGYTAIRGAGPSAITRELFQRLGLNHPGTTRATNQFLNALHNKYDDLLIIEGTDDFARLAKYADDIDETRAMFLNSENVQELVEMGVLRGGFPQGTSVILYRAGERTNRVILHELGHYIDWKNLLRRSGGNRSVAAALWKEMDDVAGEITAENFALDLAKHFEPQFGRMLTSDEIWIIEQRIYHYLRSP